VQFSRILYLLLSTVMFCTGIITVLYGSTALRNPRHHKSEGSGLQASQTWEQVLLEKYTNLHGPSRGLVSRMEQCYEYVHRALTSTQLTPVVQAFDVQMEGFKSRGPTDNRPPLRIACAMRDEIPDDSDPSGYARRLSRGWFEPAEIPPKITVIADDATPARTATLLAHEVSHANDALIHGMDFRICGELACSEIRAASAAECPPGFRSGEAQRRFCVESTAVRSTALVFPVRGEAARCVAAVFDRCYGSAISVNPMRPGARVAAAEQTAVAESVGPR
jgi:hypothetical protein